VGDFKQWYIACLKYASYGINLVLIVGILCFVIWYITGLTDMAGSKPTKSETAQTRPL
jgi:hypothetical protein